MVVEWEAELTPHLCACPWLRGWNKSSVFAATAGVTLPPQDVREGGAVTP